MFVQTGKLKVLHRKLYKLCEIDEAEQDCFIFLISYATTGN